MTYIERAQEFKDLLSGKLIEERYVHSLGVADTARILAGLYGADEDKAYIAGLLHDCTKNENPDIQLQIMEKGGIILTDTEKSNRKLWHQISGMCYIRDELKIDDSEILDAVRYHTTGKSGMSLFSKIIYIADFISPERKYEDVEVMRALAKISLDKAALYSLKYTIRKLVKKEKPVCEDSLAFYNELISKGVTLGASD